MFASFLLKKEKSYVIRSRNETEDKLQKEIHYTYIRFFLFYFLNIYQKIWYGSEICNLLFRLKFKKQNKRKNRILESKIKSSIKIRDHTNNK